MIPNMMSEWDSSGEPQSPTIVLDIKFPFPNGALTDPVSSNTHRTPGDFSFRLEIKMPTGQVSAPMIHPPIVDVQSVNPQTRNPQQLEITLRERLHQQRRNSSLRPDIPQEEPHVYSSKLLTPPSTSQSDRFSLIDGVENSLTGEDQMICDVSDRQSRQSHSMDHIVQTNPAENMPRERNQISRQNEVQLSTSNLKQPPHTTSVHQSRSISSSRVSTPTKRPNSRGKARHNSSRSPSPTNSLQRDRTSPPASRRRRSVDSEEIRGRPVDSKRLSRSPSSDRSLHDRSRSPRSRSRSRNNDRDCDMYSRPRSTSTTLYSDELAVERASSTQCSSPARVRHSSDSGGENEASGSGTKSSLQLRIGESSRPKHVRRRTCPFFHPSERDKHPLDGPHPGYSIVEFEEAVNCYENGHTLPSRLIKQGVTINPKNRPSRSPIKPTPTSSYQNHTTHLPLERRVAARDTRSRSPDGSPAKRRKLVSQPSPYAQASFFPKERSHGSYRGYPKAANSQNATQFRRDGTTPNYVKRQTDYFQGNVTGTSPILSRPQGPVYGRRPPPQPNSMYYRSQ